MQTLIKMSRRYGSDDRFVLAGGGNTSVKDEKHLYVKGSGTSLSTISEEGFVKMNRSKLGAVWNNTYSEDAAERESEVLSDLMGAVMDIGKRPSVETFPREARKPHVRFSGILLYGFLSRNRDLYLQKP